MRVHIKATVIVILISVACSSLSVFGQDRFTQREFFSYQRFAITMHLLDTVKVQPRSRRDIKAFATYFNDGIYTLSEGNYAAALIEFHKARDIWPEYFGTYFLIALTYERSDNIRKAAKFYKAYLDK